MVFPMSQEELKSYRESNSSFYIDNVGFKELKDVPRRKVNRKDIEKDVQSIDSFKMETFGKSLKNYKLYFFSEKNHVNEGQLMQVKNEWFRIQFSIKSILLLIK